MLAAVTTQHKVVKGGLVISKLIARMPGDPHENLDHTTLATFSP